jgi:peptide/nickel transport system permease protein
MIAGATVVETVFSYPGLGRTMYEAALSRDYPGLQGGFLLLTLAVVSASALADLAYPLLDPRVSRG